MFRHYIRLPYSLNGGGFGTAVWTRKWWSRTSNDARLWTPQTLIMAGDWYVINFYGEYIGMIASTETTCASSTHLSSPYV
jgi:hypothetical protein